MKRAVLSLFWCIPIAAFAAAASPDNEISYLLNVVRTSAVTFVRNGEDHTAPEAAAHMQKKRDHFEKEIKSAEDFIDKAASRSLLSGKEYVIRFSDGSTCSCSDWLLAILKQFRGAETSGQ
ncbi:MAG: DUF5329 domain-containing protein [Verrucomicrobia bacterium]|nr:DUF5329 domain-containing protein [Verrucomicrobiota bacterium]